jgi:hypothetical protein
MPKEVDPDDYIKITDPRIKNAFDQTHCSIEHNRLLMWLWENSITVDGDPYVEKKN